MFWIAKYKLLGIRSVIYWSPDIFRDVKEVIKHRSEERIVRNGDGNDINDWTGSLVWHSLLSFLLQYSANLSVSVIIYQNA